MSIGKRVCRALGRRLLGKTGEYTAPANIYVGLSTAAPGEDASTNAEPSGNNYSRVSTDEADWDDFSDADPSVSANASAITFPVPSGSWGTVTHVTLWEHASTATEAVFIGAVALDSPMAVGLGADVSFPIGDLTLSFD